MDAGHGRRASTPLLSLGGGGGIQLVRNDGTRARRGRGSPFDNKARSKVRDVDLSANAQVH
jgi:hypothetical protein